MMELKKIDYKLTVCKVAEWIEEAVVIRNNYPS